MKRRIGVSGRGSFGETKQPPRQASGCASSRGVRGRPLYRGAVSCSDPGCIVEPVSVRDPEVQTLLGALTAELARSGYTPDQTFGYSVEQLEASRVHLVGAQTADRLAGVAGIELQGEGVAELKRFFVRPEDRGSGVADALISALLTHAATSGVRLVRLETGDEQHAALRFYRRHGFARVARFSPYEASKTSVCMERAIGAADSGTGRR